MQQFLSQLTDIGSHRGPKQRFGDHLISINYTQKYTYESHNVQWDTVTWRKAMTPPAIQATDVTVPVRCLSLKKVDKEERIYIIHDCFD